MNTFLTISKYLTTRTISLVDVFFFISCVISVVSVYSDVIQTLIMPIQEYVFQFASLRGAIIVGKQWLQVK